MNSSKKEKLYNISNLSKVTTNWSQNIPFCSDVCLRPETVHEVQKICKDKQYTSIRVIGSRHCFNWIADTRRYKPGTKTGLSAHVSLEKMKNFNFERVVIKGEEDKGPQPIVTFGAGVTFTEMMDAVEKAGFGIKQLPALPHITVVGCMISATHGSGYQVMPTWVLGFDIVMADGTLKNLNMFDTPNFKSYLLNFGGLGVITSMTIRLVEDFKIHKAIYTELPWDTVFPNLDTMVQKQEYLSFFTVWNERKFTSVWTGKTYGVNEKPPKKEEDYFGAPHINTPTNNIHMIPGQDPGNCNTAGEGTWKDKIVHFLPEGIPSAGGDEIATEYFVPYDKFTQALDTLYGIRDKFKHLVQISEFRYVEEDDIPMSPAKKRRGWFLHFTWFRKQKELEATLPILEAALAKFDPKPHLGKMFILSGKRFEELYGEDLINLRKILTENDPTGKFRNNYMDKYIFNDDPDNLARPLAKL